MRALGLAAAVLETGCLAVWALSPRLTAIYNAEFSAAFFAYAPALQAVVSFVLPVLGPLAEPAGDPLGMLLRLQAGLAVMGLGYAGGLLALHVCDRPAAWLVVGASLVFRITLWLLPGLFSTDIFSYVMYGRIAAVYASNPYVHPPAEFASDPFLAWVFPFWRDQPSVYGPGWTDFSWLPSALTADRDNFGKVFSVNPLPQGNSSSASTGLTLKISRKVVSSRLLLETHRQSASGQSTTAKTSASRELAW